ncbi:MAG: hypothetical protein MZV63_62330 [Marinilabiliales bacterium]|nr:hypothetical protein [Marinilabiliales bacterium]
MAADSATVKAPARASTDPSLLRVVVVPLPWAAAPHYDKNTAIIAALLKLIIFDPTAVPNILAASLAPNDHPRKSPLVRKRKNTYYII